MNQDNNDNPSERALKLVRDTFQKAVEQVSELTERDLIKSALASRKLTLEDDNSVVFFGHKVGELKSHILEGNCLTLEVKAADSEDVVKVKYIIDGYVIDQSEE
jgi:hypothetical protein